MSWLIHQRLRVVQLPFLTGRTSSHLLLQLISITKLDPFPGPRVQPFSIWWVWLNGLTGESKHVNDDNTIHEK